MKKNKKAKWTYQDPSSGYISGYNITYRLKSNSFFICLRIIFILFFFSFFVVKLQSFKMCHDQVRLRMTKTKMESDIALIYYTELMQLMSRHAVPLDRWHYVLRRSCKLNIIWHIYDSKHCHIMSITNLFPRVRRTKLASGLNIGETFGPTHVGPRPCKWSGKLPADLI